MANLTGKEIHHYRILEQLGEGGMATVYKAYDTHNECEVAIKIIRRDAFPAEQHSRIFKRFEREARALEELSHPNIVKVIEYGEHEGSPFLVMEYASGGTLKQKLGKSIPWAEAFLIIIPIDRALDYAHKNKIIHRDVKPSNILVTDSGQLKLTDFGIAKVLESDEGVTLATTTGVGIGTPEYMAPEQGMGHEVDARADIYSLGIVLYELITGQKPFRADTPMAVVIKHVNDPLSKPSQFVSNLPKELDQILFKALAKKPEDRYQSMQEFANALERMQQSAKKKSNKQPDRERKDSVTVKSAAGHLTYTCIIPILGLAAVAIIIIFALWPFLQTKPVLNDIDALFTVPSTETTESFTKEPNTPTQTATEMPTGTPTPLPIEYTDSAGIPMILIPEGKFIMGLTMKQAAEACSLRGTECNPKWFTGLDEVHTVFLDAFYIDKYEVTNASYHSCVDAGVCQRPKEIDSSTREFYFGRDPFFDDYPVIFVDWQMANAFCKWRGVRLPTEAEWEKAARGTDGRIYPSGNVMNPTYANILLSVGDTTPVGNYESGKSPYGIYDLEGNVSEWVADWYSDEYYLNSPIFNPQGAETGENRVVKGNSWYFERDKAYGGSVGGHGGLNPNSVSSTLGFRCAISIPNYYFPQSNSTMLPEIVLPTIQSSSTLPLLNDYPTNDPNCTDDSLFIADITVPDGTTFAPGVSFTKTWRINNTGTCNWGNGYQLVNVFDNKIPAEAQPLVATVRAGQEIDVSVQFHAPDKPGEYTSSWQMSNPDENPFGSILLVIIVVK